MALPAPVVRACVRAAPQRTQRVIRSFTATPTTGPADPDTSTTIDEVRDVVRTFAALYNAEWLIEKNGHRSPLDARAAWFEKAFSRAA